MRYDGTNVQQLTDNQWEDGTPACSPPADRRQSHNSGRNPQGKLKRIACAA